MTDSLPLPQKPDDSVSQQTKRLIIVGLLTRILVDTSVQVFFPFLPIIATGLGVTEVTVGRLISLRSISGIFAPLFGAWADRGSYRLVMRVSLLLAAIGYLIIAVSQAVWVMGIGMIVAGLGTYSFGPNLAAYLSAQLPYSRRARGLGIVEYAWAFAGIIGLFLVGLLIAATSWRAPFFVFSAGLFIAAALYSRLPARPIQQGVSVPSTAEAAQTEQTSLWQRFRAAVNLGPNQRSTWSAIASGGLIMFAGVHLFVTYGTWLVNEYGLDATLLGTVALVLGISDLLGSGLVSVASDRLGKRNSVMLGSGIAAVFFFFLPALNQGVVPAIAAIFLARGTFEFTVVSNLTLLSEQAPEKRARSMTIGAATGTALTALAALTAPPIYDQFGVSGIAAVATVCLLAALLLNVVAVREPQDK